MRRIILEGLEEGGRVLSPRYKARVFTLKKKKKFRRKKRNYMLHFIKVLQLEYAKVNKQEQANVQSPGSSQNTTTKTRYC